MIDGNRIVNCQQSFEFRDCDQIGFLRQTDLYCLNKMLEDDIVLVKLLSNYFSEYVDVNFGLKTVEMLSIQHEIDYLVPVVLQVETLICQEQVIVIEQS